MDDELRYMSYEITEISSQLESIVRDLMDSDTSEPSLTLLRQEFSYHVDYLKSISDRLVGFA